MNYKTCTKCSQEKSIDNFSQDKQRSDGLYPHCKDCQKQKIANWSLKNKAWIKEYHTTYNNENKEKLKAYRENTKVHRAKYMRLWRCNNKSTIHDYKKTYHINVESKNINFKILHSLRGRLLQALNGNLKTKHTMDFVGCSLEELKIHLASQFKNGMSWETYGRRGWHIDHIKPCASFDLSKIEEQQKCFHYTNLQPLWWLDNCIKNKY